MSASPRKRLIICADGTWNKVEDRDPATGEFISTNVALLATMLARTHRDRDEQRVFYMEGVGTPEEEQVSGGAFGFGLTDNIERGYRFLVRNYTPGDLIYLFGFSRGAYTARSLGGLIRNCGIIRSDREEVVREGMRIYRNPHPDFSPNSTRSMVFRQMHSHDAQIELVGVWDTVGALGIPFLNPSIAASLGWEWHFHDTRLGSHVRHARHALAMHERRTDFPPTLWFKKDGLNPENTLKQRWFPGVHSDIGGGYPNPWIADKALLWMMEEAMALPEDRGLDFRSDALDLQREKAAKNQGNRDIHDSWQGAFKWLDRLRGHAGGARRTYLDAASELHRNELKIPPTEAVAPYLTNVELDPSCKIYASDDRLDRSFRGLL